MCYGSVRFGLYHYGYVNRFKTSSIYSVPFTSTFLAYFPRSWGQTTTNYCRCGARGVRETKTKKGCQSTNSPTEPHEKTQLDCNLHTKTKRSCFARVTCVPLLKRILRQIFFNFCSHFENRKDGKVEKTWVSYLHQIPAIRF